MDERNTAEKVLSAIGGKQNVVENSICMTRLRIKVDNPDLIDHDALNSIANVLGMTRRGPNGIEVVFGPNMIDGIYRNFQELCSISQSMDAESEEPASAPCPQMPTVAPERRRSYSLQVKANSERSASNMSSEDLDMLRGMFPESAKATPAPAPAAPAAPAVPVATRGPKLASHQQEGKRKPKRKLLVINGPNINMLGIREPATYGTEDFGALLTLCRKSAAEAGFSDCLCFQSNHEGDIVDEIQDAYQVYDGLVINPGAYTHTSIAILDAVLAVQIPTIEVHISKVNERESFRQVSYIRQAAFETIMGMGIEGYRKAIFDMWDYLEKRDSSK